MTLCTRLSNHYFPLPTVQVKYFGCSFVFDASKIWNDFPDNVRSATSIASFRKSSKLICFVGVPPHD